MASLEAARNHGVAKASWMLKQSDFLGRWKNCFCVLYRNGTFKIYKNEKMKDEQGSINLPKSCYAISAGVEIRGMSAPSGKDMHCLLELRSHEVNMLFCTDSVDDSVSWKSSLLEVKNLHMQPARPPTMALPPSCAPPPYSITQAPPPVQQVVIPPVQHVIVPSTQQYVVNPVGSVTTYTSYQAPRTQYVIPPANQTVVVNGRTTVQGVYPVQNTVYAYPGQTNVYTCQTGQSSTVTRFY